MNSPRQNPTVTLLLDALEHADTDLGWQERGRCAGTDPEIFFPEKGGSTAAAKSVCRGCLVRAECLMYALDHGERGIWGGMSERERRLLKRRPESPHTVDETAPDPVADEPPRKAAS